MLKKFIALMVIFAAPALVIQGEASVFVVEPLLVSQPPTEGVTFYVYRPESLPEGWFATFDGYAVTTSETGVWVYGTMAGSKPAATNYAVGSVNPDLLPIVPYTQSPGGPVVGALPPRLPKNSYVPLPDEPFVPARGGVRTPSIMPQWVLGGPFTEVADWHLLVDRMGILETPRAPLAWKGDNPKVIFAWTGRNWHQMPALNPDQPAKAAETLKYHIYSLTKMINKSYVRWQHSDTDILIRMSPRWGYFWMGEIKIIEN